MQSSGIENINILLLIIYHKVHRFVRMQVMALSDLVEKHTLTAASLSKRANSSLSSFTSSWALQDEDSWVKPTMSANRILEQK